MNTEERRELERDLEGLRASFVAAVDELGLYDSLVKDAHQRKIRLETDLDLLKERISDHYKPLHKEAREHIWRLKMAIDVKEEALARDTHIDRETARALHAGKG